MPMVSPARIGADAYGSAGVDLRGGRVQTPTRSSDLPNPSEAGSASGPGRPPRRSRVALVAVLVAFTLVGALLIGVLVLGARRDRASDPLEGSIPTSSGPRSLRP